MRSNSKETMRNRLMEETYSPTTNNQPTTSGRVIKRSSDPRSGSAITRSLLLLIIAGAWIAGCGRNPATKGVAGRNAARISYKDDVQPIIHQFCRCHLNNVTPPGQYDMTGPASIAKGGRSGTQVIPGQADSSGLVRRITRGEMPPTGKLADTDIKIIYDWINQGAKDN